MEEKGPDYCSTRSTSRAARRPLDSAPATVPISAAFVASPAKNSVPSTGRASARGAPFLQKFRVLPEGFPEAQHDLEDLAHLQTRQRPLFCGKRGVETHDAGLEDAERQRDQYGAGAQRR